MKLSLRIARRYLFAKKSTNAINVISAISVLGIALGTAALILVFSVFNGFEDLITGLYNTFNPDIVIKKKEGKAFVIDPLLKQDVLNLAEVSCLSETLEEIALFEYEGIQDFGVLKGVDSFYNQVTSIDSTIIRGSFSLKDKSSAILGVGMEYKLSVNLENIFAVLNVYMPKRKQNVIFGEPFKKRAIVPKGVFAIQQEFDGQYVLVSLDFARELLSYKNEVSALELKLNANANPDKVRDKIIQLVGNDYYVKDRYRQEEAFFKLMNVEKWMAFIIASFIILLLSFNMVGALWMLVLDKRRDIAILKSMGATNQTIRSIFFSEGLLLSLLGLAIGILLALFLYILQTSFGLIQLQGGATLIVDAYPVSLRASDFITVCITVITISSITSLLPAFRASRVATIIREH